MKAFICFQTTDNGFIFICATPIKLQNQFGTKTAKSIWNDNLTAKSILNENRQDRNTSFLIEN
jgi:hypothetical protein